MEFMESLNGSANRFDSNMTLGHKEIKALRDAVLFILNRLKSLEKPEDVGIKKLEISKKRGK